MKFSKIIENYPSLNDNLFESKLSFVLDKEKFTLRKIKVPGTSFVLRYYRLGDYTLIEQNPLEDSGDAKLVRKGERISILVDNLNDKSLYKFKKNKLIKL